MTKASDRDGLAAALLTPPGEGGISVIALWGHGASALTASRLKRDGSSSLQPGRLYYGVFAARDGRDLDEVIVACSGKDNIEINCHGGAIPTRLILKSLAEAGVSIVERRTLPGGRAAIAEEAMTALFDASTDLAARALVAQAGGLLEDALMDVVGLIEGGELSKARLAAWRLLQTHATGAAFVEPPAVAVVGPVNAGKSTLVNALAGYDRTIVTDVPGTTRDAVRVPVALEGVPVILVDTAGAAAVDTPIEKKAAEAARGALETASAVLFVYDASVPLGASHLPPEMPRGCVIAANKNDLPACRETLEALKATQLPLVRTSGSTGVHLKELALAVLAAAGVVPPGHDAAERPIVFSSRQYDRISLAVAALDEGRASLAAEEILRCIEGE